MKGIVLSKIRYKDNALIVTLFDEDYGKKTFFKTISKKGKEQVYFEPLSFIDYTTNNSSNKKWQSIKSLNLLHTYPKDNILLENCSRYFISDFLNKVLHEEGNPHLFQFLSNTILEIGYTNYSDQLIRFLIEISPFLGVYIPSNGSFHFDLIESDFCQLKPSHGSYLDKLELLNVTKFKSGVELNKLDKKNLFETLMRFYSFHFEGLQNLKSLDILKEVLN